MKPIYWIGGCKGGVGRSMISMSLLHRLLMKGEDVLLIDANVSYPDVPYIYKDVPCELLDLDQGDAWCDLANLIEVNPDRTIIINTGSNRKGTNKYGSTLNDGCKELGRDVIALWALNPHREDLEPLQEYMWQLPDAKVHLLWNEHQGDLETFEHFRNNIKARELVEARGGMCLPFPNLSEVAVDYIRLHQTTIEETQSGAGGFTRASMRQWLNDCDRLFDVLENQTPKEECDFADGWEKARRRKRDAEYSAVTVDTI